MRQFKQSLSKRLFSYDDEMTLPTIANSVLHAIGHTPLVRLRHLAPEDAAEVLMKLEFYNPTGSYKDRMALAMIEGAEARGALRPGMRVIEYTGGSTGSSLAMVCAAKGYRFMALSSDAYARENCRRWRHLAPRCASCRVTAAK